MASESECWSGSCIMKASAVLWGRPLRRAGCAHADVRVGLLVNRPPLLLTHLITILVYLLTDLQGPSLLQLSRLGLQAYSLLFEYKIRLNLQSFSPLSCEIMGWCKVSPSPRVTVRASHSREQWTVVTQDDSLPQRGCQSEVRAMADPGLTVHMSDCL